MRLITAAIGLAAASSLAGTALAMDDPVVWSNIAKFPGDLETAIDAWSAIRSEPPFFVSYRVAADDFELKETTRITGITYYSAIVDPPDILGGDWYFFTFEELTGRPGSLIAAGPGEKLSHTDSGLVNASFGTVFENVMEIDGPELPPGRYFLAFRTHQALPVNPVGKPNNVAITARTQIGAGQGFWNFGVFADGTVFDAWLPMSTFTLTPDHEWAFEIRGVGGCYADCDQSTGAGVLDFFDFICFQDRFGVGDPYACDCDLSTGVGVCDFFDFICFQDAFAAGC